MVVLRDAAGKLIMPLEKADISKLLAAGWKPPIPFSVKARDGKTDLYGMMFRPTNFDPAKKYPIINYAYPGPQSGSVGSRSFAAAQARQAGARRTRLRRRVDRRHGHARPLEVVPRRVLRRHGARQHAARPGGGHEGAGAALSLDRHRPRGHVGPLGRRVHRRRRDVPLPRLLQGRHLGVGQPRPARLRGRLGRALPGPAREGRQGERQLRGRSQPDRSRRTSRASSCSPTA